MQRILFALAAALVAMGVMSGVTLAEPPRRQIPFSAKVSLAVPQTYTFRFSLWDAAAGGVELWSEERPPLKLTTTTLSHVLGSVGGGGLPEGIFGEQVWVQVERRTATGGLARVGSRTILRMVPYAIHALTTTAPSCINGDFVYCYEGPPGTLGVGTCAQGTRSCIDWAWGSCVGQVHPAPEVCDNLDNDCNPASADGAADPLNGTVCDGADTDLCVEGTRGCASGALVCNDTTGSTVDLCNNVDDDCDAASADGSEDPLNGAACDGADSDLCTEGTGSCAAGVLVCSDATGSALDVCNGLNDDCDAASADGSEDPLNGTVCDGVDTDLCAEGTRVCASGALACSDNTSSTVDVCNGTDDDCDAASADGSEDPLNGTACDGVDTDLCAEGTRGCDAGALVCNDATGSTLDLCNGLNDDCDAASADGSEDPLNGTACDGTDSDLCLEGVRSCAAGALVCSDSTSSTDEICGDQVDNDCDGFTDEECL